MLPSRASKIPWCSDDAEVFREDATFNGITMKLPLSIFLIIQMDFQLVNDENNPKVDCAKHHFNRRRYFVMNCMAEFKRRNKTWVLLTDVDSWLLNQKREDDPIAPLDEAQDVSPTLGDWNSIQTHLGSSS